MKLAIIIFIVLLIFVLYIAQARDEGLWPPRPLVTNVYTITPNARLSTPTSVAQMWWQPVSYILNPFF